MQASTMTPDEAIQRLRDGNLRFMQETFLHPHTDAKRRQATAREGQAPFAAILACADSRVPVEHIFDAGIGDLFVVRVAGNVCRDDEAASLEYAIVHTGVSLCVVLAHTDCGAVKAVCNTQTPIPDGPLARLTQDIRIALEEVRNLSPQDSGDGLIPRVIHANMWHAVENLLQSSQTARERIAEGRLQVIAALYDIASGRVDWWGAHPKQQTIIEQKAQ